VRLQDLMAIYAAIARGGNAVPLIWQAHEVRNFRNGLPVMSRVSAWYVSDILSGVAPPVGASQQGIAYKTGTSYGYRDAWAIGFDGKHTIGVWLGRADGAAMPGELGADLAAPLLFDLFSAIKPALDPLPPPPDAALTVSNAELPYNLRVFRRPGSLAMLDSQPEITFPPDGARIFVGATPQLVAKVDRGIPPFTWLANGVPVTVGSYERQVDLPISGPGFLSIAVIDATGFSRAVQVEVE
jgi:penicillin-binding protein 1C